MPEHPLLDDGQPPEDPTQVDHSGFDEAVAARERIDKENAKVPPHAELGDLRNLALRIGATLHKDGWHLPFYHSAGRRETLPLEDWLERRRTAAEVLGPIDTGLMNRLECGCYNKCIGHPERQPLRGVSDEELARDLEGFEDDEPDNWAHRSDTMRCRTCMFYVPKGDGTIGRCRHSAPTLKGWPAIYPTDWCGAHKIDETKV